VQVTRTRALITCTNHVHYFDGLGYSFPGSVSYWCRVVWCCLDGTVLCALYEYILSTPLSSCMFRWLCRNTGLYSAWSPRHAALYTNNEPLVEQPACQEAIWWPQVRSYDQRLPGNTNMDAQNMNVKHINNQGCVVDDTLLYEYERIFFIHFHGFQ